MPDWIAEQPVQYADGITIMDQVCRRAGHVSWTWNERLCIWGGVVEHIYNRPKGPNRAPSNGNNFHDTAQLLIYDPVQEDWRIYQTCQDIPPPTVGALAVFHPHSELLYMYGGLQDVGVDDYNLVTSRDLYRLDMQTLAWCRLSPRGEEPPPAEKGISWANKDDIFFFGGYSDNVETSEKYHSEKDQFSQQGWHNACFKYDTRANEWVWPKYRGTPPSPRAGAAAGVVGEFLVLFGGRARSGRLNDLHVMEMDSSTWHCLDEGTPLSDWEEYPGLPPPRSLHTLTQIPGDRLLLYGGLSRFCAPINDCWTFSLQDGKWTEVKLSYDHGEVRCWHTAQLANNSDVLIHSGLTQEYYLTRLDLDDHCESLLEIGVGPRTLLRLSIDVVTTLLEKNCDSLLDDDIKQLHLPLPIQRIISRRIRGDGLVHQKPAPSETQYSRSRLRQGI